ncbi:hypothetical protein ZWY2020_032952 [Hordeum vulgare]|nr:hypothetical protein ZWY2020_032952 [Hordeum vulgare]
MRGEGKEGGLPLRPVLPWVLWTRHRSAWGTSRFVTWRWSISKRSSANITWCCSTIGEGVLDLDGGEDASWVPDQYTGVFVPTDAFADADADADAHGGGTHPAPPHLYGGVGGSASVLDQAVFVREEEMEDVERPAMDLTDANGSSKH